MLVRRLRAFSRFCRRLRLEARIDSLLMPWPARCMFWGNNRACLEYGISVNQPIEHAELIASYRKVAADAAKKTAMVVAASSKGPRAITAASETASKAGRRRDVLASKLAKLGVVLTD